jgi:hypothetical protein
MQADVADHNSTGSTPMRVWPPGSVEGSSVFLRANGCDQAQGYYIARPMPVEELELLWRSTGGIAPGVVARR